MTKTHRHPARNARTRLAFSTLILTALSLPTLTLAKAPAKALIAITTSGAVQGEIRDGIASWKGIPFAAPPVGPLRWRAPVAAPRWQGLRPAVEYGHDCMQEPFPSDAAPLGTPPAEDCLYLNVWKPAHARKTAKLPVVLWIYGGGFVNGGSSPPTYTGAALAKKGVMFVSFNYRLGRFGTFAHPALSKAREDAQPSANYGYLDQIAALRWVHANIAAFGGDPRNITVIGESAGGMSVHMVLTSPKTRGMVARAVVMSGGDGGGIGERTLAQAEATGAQFMAAKGIAEDDPQALAKMRALPAPAITDGLGLGKLLAGGKRDFSSPFPDGVVTVDVAPAYRARAFTRVPVMIGATSADSGGPTGAMIAGASRLAGDLARAGVPVYAYRFSYVAQSLAHSGAQHASDIPFFFNTQAIKYGQATTPRDNGMGEAISSYLANFAKKGDPNGGALPAWPSFDPAKDVLMDFAADGTARAIPDPLHLAK